MLFAASLAGGVGMRTGGCPAHSIMWQGASFLDYSDACQTKGEDLCTHETKVSSSTKFLSLSHPL